MTPDYQTAVARVGPRPSAEVRTLLSRAAEVFARKPFKPCTAFAGGHRQTLAGYAWPRRFRLRSRDDSERLFEVAPGARVLAHCRWQAAPTNHATLLVWHGIEGSTASIYMQAIADKGFRAGFNIVRVNLRNCGGTEHLTPTLYHGGLSEDLRTVTSELINNDGLSRICLIGFSLGGNLVLKLAGEYGAEPPREVLTVCAVSPSVDLSASADAITAPSNWLYHQDFLRRLRRRIHLKKKLFPNLYDTSGVHQVRTIREFDERFTAVAHGFANAADYYHKASAIRVIDRIRLPTLIIHAQDDPFIPFAPLRGIAVSSNPYILLLAPERGGHVAFISAKPDRSLRYDSLPEDRFWAENRVVEFCRLATTGR